MNVHVIGPVIRDPSDDHLIELGGERIALSVIYDTLRNDQRFTAQLPTPNDVLDAAPPATLFAAMQQLIAKADRVIWVYHREPAGAVETGIAIAAAKPLHILAPSSDLPRIIKGIPNALISADVSALANDVASGKTAAKSLHLSMPPSV